MAVAVWLNSDCIRIRQLCRSWKLFGSYSCGSWLEPVVRWILWYVHPIGAPHPALLTSWRSFMAFQSALCSSLPKSCQAMEIVAASSAASRRILTANAVAWNAGFVIYTMQVVVVFVFVRNAALLGESIVYAIAAIVADVIR